MLEIVYRYDPASSIGPSTGLPRLDIATTVIV